VFELRRSGFRCRLPAAALAAFLVLSAVGCDNAEFTPDAPSTNAQGSASTTASPTQAGSAATQSPEPHLTDYSRLLLDAGDLSDQEDTFSERSSAATPNGLPGASTLFVNADDTRAISVTVAVYPGPPTATATLRQAIATANTVVTGGNPTPLPVGTDGTVIKGTAPDGGKAVTLVLFTQGPALARLEFDSATGDATTDQFVTNIAKMQQIALRVGFPNDPE
jgi:hypothetical protein